MSGMIEIMAALGDAGRLRRRPHARDARLARGEGKYSAEARVKIEQRRMEVNEAMARIFDPGDGVDLVIMRATPTSPLTPTARFPESSVESRPARATTAG